MSQTEQPRKIRATSAHPPAGSRPKSGKNRKVHQRTEFIDNCYGSNYAGVKKAKMFSMRQFPDADISDLSRLLPKAEKITKDR